ncbi:hypothetical protein JCM11641_006926 [Rhodosporidiobolus odoratus]
MSQPAVPTAYTGFVSCINNVHIRASDPSICQILVAALKMLTFQDWKHLLSQVSTFEADEDSDYEDEPLTDEIEENVRSLDTYLQNWREATQDEDRKEWLEQIIWAQSSGVHGGRQMPPPLLHHRPRQPPHRWVHRFRQLVSALKIHPDIEAFQSCRILKKALMWVADYDVVALDNAYYTKVTLKGSFKSRSVPRVIGTELRLLRLELQGVYKPDRIVRNDAVTLARIKDHVKKIRNAMVQQ